MQFSRPSRVKREDPLLGTPCAGKKNELFTRERRGVNYKQQVIVIRQVFVRTRFRHRYM